MPVVQKRFGFHNSGVLTGILPLQGVCDGNFLVRLFPFMGSLFVDLGWPVEQQAASSNFDEETTRSRLPERSSCSMHIKFDVLLTGVSKIFTSFIDMGVGL
jgi:hypothetical protein